MEEIWKKGSKIRINNFDDKNKKAHSEKDIKNQVNFLISILVFKSILIPKTFLNFRLHLLKKQRINFGTTLNISFIGVDMVIDNKIFVEDR